MLTTQYRKRIYTIPISIPRPKYIYDNVGEDIKENFVILPKISYNEIDIEGMRTVGRLAKKIMKHVFENIAIGMTTNSVDYIIYQKIIENNAYPSLFGYRKYVRSSFISPNNVANHGMPDFYLLSAGDILTVDFAVYYQGYHIDIADTVLIGDVDKQALELCEMAKKCTYNIISSCKEGQRFNIIGKIVRETLKNSRFSVIPEFAGHGIGKNLYESPQITFDEPIITEGKPKVYLWPNTCTFSTKDLRRTAKFERTIMITESGAEVLTD
ncbi:unnamed protein product [Gordionus sp. m RMFG-2023]